MNYKVKTLCLFLLASILSTHAIKPNFDKTLLDKTCEWVARSKPAYWFNKYVPSKITKTVLSNEAASEEYQILGKEAQFAVGIPEKNHVPIIKINPDDLILSGKGFLACAGAEAIYVDESSLNKRSYGANRCTLFHEAIHIKYRDKSSSIFLGIFELGLIGFMALKTIPKVLSSERGIVLNLFTAAFFCGITTTNLFFERKLSYYVEHRADTEGCLTTQCATCVQEKATFKRKCTILWQNKNSKKGYLNADELDKIANHLGQKNKICSYHQNKRSTALSEASPGKIKAIT